jgi:serine/threonine protein kinase
MDQELDSLKIIDFGITKEVSELSQRKNSCVGSVYFI